MHDGIGFLLIVNIKNREFIDDKKEKGNEAGKVFC